MRKVVWSIRALTTLETLVIRIDLDRPLVAERISNKIFDAAERLARHSIGRPGRLEGTYEKTVVDLPYIICYTIRQTNEGREEIIILHIIHSARHWPKGTLPN